VPTKKILQPTYGRKITKLHNHMQNLSDLPLHFEDSVLDVASLNAAAQDFRFVLRWLTATPAKESSFDEATWKKVSQRVRKFLDSEYDFIIRSQPNQQHIDHEARRSLCMFQTPSKQKAYGIVNSPSSPDATPAMGQFRKYFNMCRNGGNVCEYYLPIMKTSTPPY
jgi:hypothetical protein